MVKIHHGRRYDTDQGASNSGETFTRIPIGKPQLWRCIMAEINVGNKAPDFTLPISLEDKMTLSDVLKDKKVVLVFYLFDFAGDMEGL